MIIDTDSGQILLFVCDNITVQNQQLCNTTYGIILGYTTNCLISNNIINSNNMGGINLNILSNDNTITGNTICSNNREGIGLYAAYSNTITGNTISSNNRSGIEFWDYTDRNIITNNTIYSNIVYGISLPINSIDNVIYHNNFKDNVVNANDEGDNIWDNGYPSGGNFWDDYNGSDSNGDGLGDTPYPIPDGYNEDRYPLGNFKPNNPLIEGKRRFKAGEGGEYPYVINSTDPEEDDIYYLISWSDGPQDETGYYASGEEITINVTIPLEKGTYDILKIKAIDIFGAESNWTILEVIVPRSRVTIDSLFQLFFKCFPLLERLLYLLR
jgi:parallel beta-helix repeat protein